MTQKLRIGCIGIGGIFTGIHGPALLNHPEVEIVAVCDIVEEKAQKFATAHNIPHVFTNYHDLLQLNLDAVDICTPNLLHSQIAVAALNRGMHVFTEKPDAVSTDEARRMADAARASGKTLMAMRNNRFTPHIQFLKQFIAEGHMGDIYTGRVGWIRRRGIPGKGGWFTTKALSGGGPLIDLGVHYLDLAMYLMGNPAPVTLSGSTYTKFAHNDAPNDSAHSKFGEARSQGTFDVEDLATGFIRFNSGASLQIEFSWASNIDQETQFLELRGTKAGFSLRNWELTLYSEIAGTLVDIHPKLPKMKLQHHAAHLHHFIDVIQRRAQPINTPDHGIHIVSVLTGLYQSATQNKEIQL